MLYSFWFSFKKDIKPFDGWLKIGVPFAFDAIYFVDSRLGPSKW